MSVDEVRRGYAAGWSIYIGQTAAKVDEGQHLVSMYHPQMVYSDVTDLLTNSANVAVENILEALRRRIADFPLRRMSQSGLHWVILRCEYMTACAEVRAVRAMLGLAIELLLDDARELPQPAVAAGSPNLPEVLRSDLVQAQEQLGFKTERFLRYVESYFTVGHRPVQTVVASSRSLGVDRRA